MKEKLFFTMIETLRKEEEVILSQNLFKIGEDEKKETIIFLKSEFNKESLSYPFHPPVFNKKAGIWAAEVVYIAAQLLLYRKNPEKELPDLFPKEVPAINPETILSVDLCLRFLPSILEEIKLIDKEDPLIPFLDKTLLDWHYSAINYFIEFNKLNFEEVFTNKCLTQLYLNRIIKYNNTELIKNVEINQLMKSNLGIYQSTFWANYKEIEEDE